MSINLLKNAGYLDIVVGGITCRQVDTQILDANVLEANTFIVDEITVGGITGTTGTINVLNANSFIVDEITAGGITGTTGTINNLTLTELNMIGGSNKYNITSASLSSNETLTIRDSKTTSHILLGADNAVGVQPAQPFESIQVNAQSGILRTTTLTLSAGSQVDFPVLNSCLTQSSQAILTSIQRYTGTLGTNGIPYIVPYYAGAGTFRIYVYNIHPTNALNGSLDISFLLA